LAADAATALQPGNFLSNDARFFFAGRSVVSAHYRHNLYFPCDYMLTPLEWSDPVFVSNGLIDSLSDNF